MDFINEVNDLANEFQLDLDKVNKDIDRRESAENKRKDKLNNDIQKALHTVDNGLKALQYKPLEDRIWNKIEKYKKSILDGKGKDYDLFLYLMYRLNKDKRLIDNFETDSNYYEEVENEIATQYVKIYRFLKALQKNNSKDSVKSVKEIISLWDEYYNKKLSVFVKKEYEQTLKEIKKEAKIG